ncbi:MAG: T9SS type A sorting domain-containing protein [Bacteroidota bacterium]|nr:T9SS type A sorting domain-containing protein [Bacteroidota bacterium]MDP4234101.1 T9SS type A sorting domain-containing protein [Bacteroidota bacterium]MDP4243042.1 T9SS type A sorting domain-containing protein [Bacteroidota bacterium]MDP4287468.1 T9SS type A sorting domain-containing protein [Bacteroidota bacterium]
MATTFASSARATGEIALVRAPEEIPEGDDVTVLVSATARETDIDRILALQYPDSWKPKRAWRVEAGGSDHVAIIPDPEIQSLFTPEKGQKVIALADYLGQFDPDAAGVAYFIVFRTKAVPGAAVGQSATIKAALIERTNPDAPPQIDPKTKRPKPVNTSWRMTYPAKPDFSFAGTWFRRLVASVRLERVIKTARAFDAEGRQDGTASLHTSPESIREYFRHPFSLQFWLRTTEPEQTFLQLQSSDGSDVVLAAGLLGQPLIIQKRPQRRTLLQTRGIANDGVWHNLVISHDSLGKLRLFFDGQPPSITDMPKGFLANVTSITLGDTTSENDFSIDELRMMHGAYRDPSEFERAIALHARDTLHNAFAVFHFDELSNIARSSVPLYLSSAVGAKAEPVPTFFVLDSGAVISESTSPVQLDPVMLTADLLSATNVSIHWKTTCELGIKQFRLERRVGTFGPFEKVLVIDAKHGMKAPKRGQSIVSRNNYSANEELPKLNGDIELYYRLATIGYNEKEMPTYSLPVKLEYGADRDVFVEQNQPNPFNPTTQLAFRLPKATPVKLSVFDMIGREVSVIVNGKLEAGRHVYTLDATNWPGGIYFYKVKTPKTTITRKMVLAK